MGPLNSFPQFLHVLGGSGCSYQSQSKSKGDINREVGLPPIHKVIGAEPHGRIFGAVVSMHKFSNTALPVRLAFWRQHPQHINDCGINSFALAIHLAMVQTGSEFICPH